MSRYLVICATVAALLPAPATAELQVNVQPRAQTARLSQPIPARRDGRV
jgi:hypothetical protein